MLEEQLDDPSALEATDRRGVLRSLASAGAQVRQAHRWAVESGLADLDPGQRPRSVVVAALGAGTAVGDCLAVLAGTHSPVPVTVRHAEPLPGWVGPMDLVIAVSQSGRAPGPVALAAEAARRGAAVMTLGAADSPLADVSARARGHHVPLADGPVSSRTGLWASLVPALVAAHRWGMLECPPEQLEGLADALDDVAQRCRPSAQAIVNPAKLVALDLADHVPLALADGELLAAAARRAATMWARTAGVPMTVGELPSSAASVLSCLDGPFADSTSGPVDSIFADPYLDGPGGTRLALLALRDVVPEAIGGAPGDTDGSHPEAPEHARRHNGAQAVIDSARDRGVRVHEVTAHPGAPVSRLGQVIALLDFAAAYAAVGSGRDPSHPLRRL